MILQTGQRTDIPAFYGQWLINRVRQGFVDVRNPYNPIQITRYPINHEVVDGIAFCTKNPLPFIPLLHEINDYRQYWHMTITPYGCLLYTSMKRTDNAIVFTISAPTSIMDYVIYKGSITIDGISLTIMERTESTFSVSIIPHTLSETVLGHASIGTEVNLETDITGRYIRHFMTLDEPTHTSKSQKSMESLLVENGFM